MAPATKDLATRSTVTTVRDEIIARLADGRLSPGQRMVTSDIADELGISRGPVREAMHILAGEGVVELLPNKGARIHPISHQDILDVLRLLSPLGGLAIEQAAIHMDNEAGRAEVESKIGDVLKALDDHNALRFYKSLQQFHNTLNDLVGSRSLNNAFAHLHMEYFNRRLAAYVPGDHWKQFKINYTNIRRALLAGKGAEAKAFYEAHLQWVIGLIANEMNER